MENTNKRKTGSLRVLIAALLCLIVPYMASAQQAVTVQGRVTDAENQPLIGVSVLVKGTTTGVSTGIDGDYTITAPADGTLEFAFLGLKTQDIEIGSRSIINVVMEEDKTSIDEVVVVGYGVQKRGSVTGAVAGVKGSEMIQTKNENPQNMLAGRVAGLRVWQKSSEPGTFSNSFDIRGMGSPLVIIDGIPRTTEEFQRLNPNDIEDVSVLKDASAAIYGVRAANGVVLVTTKQGREGQAKVSYNGSFTFQVPSKMPKLANAYEAMTLYNEQSMNKVDGGSIIYTEDDFEAFRNGTRRTTDWNSLLFSDFSPQTQHDISISGGTEKTKYYVSMGYFYQEGFFRSGDLNYDKFNLRSNLSTKIAKGLTFDLNISGIADQRNTPYTSSVDIIRNYWKQGVLYPAYADPENTMLNYEGLDLQQNTIAMMDSDISGYRKYDQKFFESSAALNLDFGAFAPALQGLTAKGLFSFDYRLNNNEIYRKEYYLYAYDEDTDSYNHIVYNGSSPSQLRREQYSKQQVLGQFVINYDRTFGRHHVSGLVGWEVQKRIGDNFYAQRDLAYSSPYLMAGVDAGQLGGMSSSYNDIYELANEALIGRVNYDFDNRYLIEAQFRYDGSSKFAKGHQWGFFPSVSAGWRISEEPFIKNSDFFSFIDQLKLRTSYGVLGDDGDLQYDWATGYTYPSTSGNAEKGYYNQYAPGYIFGGEFVYAATPLALPNENITWYTSHTFNIGVDFEGWNGLFGFSLDYFNRYRKGMFARRSGDLPTVVGASAPRENLDSDRQFGLELELTHRNRIGEFAYNIKAIATITRNKYLTASEKGPWGNSYDRWRNDNLTHRYQGIQFGYESAGRYESWEDIWSYDIYKDRDVLPGDYKYVDWNGDGEINSLDEHPFAFDQTPWMNFSLSFDATYRNRPLAAVPGFGTRLDGVQGAALLDLGIERRRHPRAVSRQMASRRSQRRPLRSRNGMGRGILRIHGPLPEEQLGVQPREHVVPASQEHRDRLHAAQVQARIDDEPARLCQRIQPVHDHRRQVRRSGTPGR